MSESTNSTGSKFFKGLNIGQHLSMLMFMGAALAPLIFWSGVSYGRITQLEEQVITLTLKLDKITDSLLSLSQQVATLQGSLSFHRNSEK